PAAASEAGEIDLVAGVVHDERPDERASAVREEVQLLAEGVDRDLEILDDRIALVLILEGVLPGAGERVLRHVEHLADADGLVLAPGRITPPAIPACRRPCLTFSSPSSSSTAAPAAAPSRGRSRSRSPSPA